MTPAQLSVLNVELQSDPLNLGYASCFPNCPGHAVDLLNSQTQTAVQAITAAVAMTWAAAGPYAAVVDASNNINHPCRASCLVIRDAFSAGLDIHLESADLQSMLTMWVANSIITQAQHDALTALAAKPTSRGFVLGLGNVTEADVRAALGT